MIKSFIISILLLATVGASAANYSVKLPPGTYKVWLLSGQDSGPAPSTAIETDKSPISLPGKGKSIAVLNEANGTLAILPAKDTVTVTAKDFDRVSEVDISIQQGAGPIGTASVTLMGQNPVSELLDPSMNGIAKFYGVKIGPISVKIQYNVNGVSQTTVQQLSVMSDHSQAIQTIAIAVPSGNTSSATQSGKNSASASSAVKSKVQNSSVTSILGKLLQILIGFAVVAALVYGGYWLIKKDPAAVSQKLRAMGAPIPPDFNAANDPNANLEPVVTPPPVQVVQSQIMLENSAPDPVSSIPQAGVGASIQSSPNVFSDRPRLVRDNGEDWVIQDGSSIIGRETGLAISVIDDSTISRKHGEFSKAGSEITFQDLGSSNGSYLNGQKIVGSVQLSPGDTLQLGKVVFKVEAS